LAAQDRNKVCPKCFEVNDPAATYCIECGAPLSDDPASEGSDQEVYREITQANLHRIRGDYKPAIDVCLGILKRFPNNGTAHTLLGDIYAEKGELEQAAQWYEMALDLRPESENDRRKLESVQRRMAEQEAANNAQQLGIPPDRPKTQQYVFVMVVLVAIVGIASFMLGGAMSRKEEPKDTLIEDPIIVGGREEPSGDSAQAEPEEVVPEIWPGTAVEQQVLKLLKANATIGANILTVHEDPRGPTLSITALQGTFTDPVQVVAEVANVVFGTYTNYALASVRVINGEQTVFTADVNQADWQRARSEQLPPLSMMTQVWPAQPTTPEGTTTTGG
jgi:hypothetical protein